MAEPQQVVIIGAGVGGLGTALALARAGHHVTIVERDATPTPADPDAAFAWDRRGAPQVRHSHALLARLRNLLRDSYPDVLTALLAAGATEMRFGDNPPPEMSGWEPEPGDEDLVAIACRRTTFEWVLRRTVLDEANVSLLDGVAVEHLCVSDDKAGADTAGSTAPRITGVEVTHVDGGSEILPADVVVAATGRRSGVVRWLDDLGVTLTVDTEDTGIIYLSRFYRLNPASPMPDQRGPIGGDLGYLKYAVFQGDNRTFSVTFAVSTDDHELRERLLDPDTFDRAARELPATAVWAEPGLAEAITPVHVMAGLLNRRIRFVDPEGRPQVLGLHAVGDAHTCTNPLYGRGCSLAMVQATLLADALATQPDDLAARARAYEEASVREIEPWYRAAVAQDRMARAQPPAGGDATDTTPAAASTDTTAPEPGAGGSASDFMGEIMREGLFPAVRTDPVVFRAFLRAFNLLVAPDALLSDPDIIGRVLAVYQDRENRPPEPSPGPGRDEMLVALNRV